MIARQIFIDLTDNDFRNKALNCHWLHFAYTFTTLLQFIVALTLLLPKLLLFASQNLHTFPFEAFIIITVSACW